MAMTEKENVMYGFQQITDYFIDHTKSIKSKIQAYRQRILDILGIGEIFDPMTEQSFKRFVKNVSKFRISEESHYDSQIKKAKHLKAWAIFDIEQNDVHYGYDVERQVDQCIRARNEYKFALNELKSIEIMLLSVLIRDKLVR